MKRAFLIGLPILLLFAIFIEYRIKHPDANGWLRQQTQSASKIEMSSFNWPQSLGLESVISTDFLSIKNPEVAQKLFSKLNCTGRLDNPYDRIHADEAATESESVHYLTVGFEHKDGSSESLLLYKTPDGFRLQRSFMNSNPLDEAVEKGATFVSFKSVNEFLKASRKIINEARQKRLFQVTVEEENGC